MRDTVELLKEVLLSQARLEERIANLERDVQHITLTPGAVAQIVQIVKRELTAGQEPEVTQAT